MILAIGNSNVYEISAFNEVLNELKKLGETALLFKQDKCLEGEFFSYSVLDNKDCYEINIDGQKYDVNNFSAVWYLKPHLPLELREFNMVEYRAFIDRQFRAMRVALWSLLRNKNWINDPWLSEISENKIFQISKAIESGFSIPDTIITSDPKRVKTFYDKNNGNIVTKILAVSPISNHVIYTNKVAADDIEQIDSVLMSPAIFQELIEKDFELRITVVGKSIFAAKVLSQEFEISSLDWRRASGSDDFQLRLDVFVLPAEVKNKILMLMKKLGLQFGCIDMIVTKDGRYIFLEINPNGQWYFVETATKMNIPKAIASLLVTS